MPVNPKDIRVLVINSSPRKKSHTGAFAASASEGARDFGATVVEYAMAGKDFQHCKESCRRYHDEKGNCCLQDDFHELASEWIRADAVIYCVPIFAMGLPSALMAFITRIGACTTGRFKGVSARLLKVGGVIAQGNTHYGGQEVVMQYINHHLLMKNCVPITSDMPESYIGVGGRVDSNGLIDREEEVLLSCRRLGVRVAEMAMIIRAGKEILGDDILPADYFYDQNLPFSHPNYPKSSKL